MVNTLNELGKVWDKVITPVLQEQSIGRKLIPLNQSVSGLGIGQTSVASNAYTATAGAVINYEIQNNIAETVDVTTEVLKIPVQQDDRTCYGWQCNRRTSCRQDIQQRMESDTQLHAAFRIVNKHFPDGSIRI
jgi:hypothetical protein